MLHDFWCYCSVFSEAGSVCMLWVCSGLTGALEKPAVSGGCWTAVLTWLLVYLQQCCGQGFINLRVKRRRLFSPVTALHLSCWPANASLKMQPPQTPGTGRAGWKGSVWSIVLTSLFQSGMMLDVLFCVSFQIKHNCFALVKQLCPCWCLSSNEYYIATY